MPTYTEGTRISDFLKWEINPSFNREVVTLITGQNLKCGAVLGKITASGKYTACDKAAADGSQTGAGVLLKDTDATAADVKTVALVRGPAIVSSGSFSWKGTMNAGNKTAAIADLAALQIIDRAQA